MRRGQRDVQRPVLRALVPLFALALAGCASLPSLEHRSVSHAIEAPPASALRAAIDPLVAAHPSLS